MLLHPGKGGHVDEQQGAAPHAEAGEHRHIQLPLGQTAEQALVAAELELDLRLRVLAVIFADLRDDGPQLIGPGITDAQIRRCAERGLLPAPRRRYSG